MMHINLQTCRVCHDIIRTGDGLSYALRHNAHWGCFLKRRGRDAYLALPDWQKVKFPWRLLKDHDLLNEADAALKRLGKKAFPA